MYDFNQIDVEILKFILQCLVSFSILVPVVTIAHSIFLPFWQKYRLIDTAGIRRRASVASSGSATEVLSVNRAFRAIRRSDVVALVIEAMACITEQVICLCLLCT